MHGRLCRRKPTRKANARRHSVHAHVTANEKKKSNLKRRFLKILKRVRQGSRKLNRVGKYLNFQL